MSAFAFVDSNIWNLLALCPEFVAGFDCLITCIDSGPEVGVVRGLEVDLRGQPFEVHGQFVVLHSDTMIRLSASLFTGFDEFYCFEPGKWRAINPNLWDKVFTSERMQLDSSVPTDFLDLFSASGATRYASDGVGLNVFCEDAGLTRKIAQVLPPLGYF